MAHLALYTLALSALASASRSGLQDLASYPKYEVQFLADRPIKLSDAQRCEQFGLATDDDWLDLRPRAGSARREKEHDRIEPAAGSEAAESSEAAVTAAELAKGAEGEVDHPLGAGELAGANTAPQLVRMHFTHEEYDAPHGYMCALPSLNTTAAQQAAAKAKQDEPEPDPNKSWEALDYLEDRCLYAIHGWFTYAYCHNQYIRQFHQAPGGKPGPNGFEPKEDTSYEAYNLGFSRGREHDRAGGAGEMPRTTFGIGPWSRYLVQRWTDGTRCAETRRPREVEVQVHCSLSSGDSIYMIKEVSLCQYVLVIYTPSLCSLPGFRPQSALDVEPAGIRCREMMEDDDFEQWDVDRRERERREQEGKLLEAAKSHEERRAKEGAEARIRASEEAGAAAGGGGNKAAKHAKGRKGAEKDRPESDSENSRGSHVFTEDDLADVTLGGRKLEEPLKQAIVDVLRNAFGAGGDEQEIEVSFLDLHGGGDDDDGDAHAAGGGGGGLGLPIIKLEDLADAAKLKVKEAADQRKKQDARHRPKVQVRDREAGNLGVRRGQDEKRAGTEPKAKGDRAAGRGQKGQKGQKGHAHAEDEEEPLRDEL